MGRKNYGARYGNWLVYEFLLHFRQQLMAADRAMFFFPRPRVVYRISSSRVANATETLWIMDEHAGENLSFLFSVFINKLIF